MPRMGKFPAFGKRFFRRARKLLGCAHTNHLWRAVMVVAAAHGRRSLRKVQDTTKHHRSRQALAKFLTKAEWDAPEVLAQTAIDTLKQLGWTPGQTVYLALDDTQKEKRGKQMDAVARIFLHAEKRYAFGHTILGAALIYRGVAVPCAVKLYAPKDFCQDTQDGRVPGPPVEFCKLTEMAADMVRQLALPDGKVIVLFDAYYLCPAVTEACRERSFRYVGVAKKNRNFWPDARRRDRRKLSRYGANLLRREGRQRQVGGKPHCLVHRVGQLSKLGRVKLVCSRRLRETTWIALATNETRWSPHTVLSHYLNRWSIEVFFKMSKQYLGLGDYQMLRYRAVDRYLHLVLIAHLLLTHLTANELGAKALQGSDSLRLPSVPQMQQRLRERLWQDTIQNMEKGTRYRKLAKKIKDLIQLG